MTLRQFADFAVSHRSAPLPEDLVHASTRAAVDWFASTVPGATMAPARILREALRENAGDRGAHLVPDGALVSPRTAALINGTASHTAELDDIYRDGLYHPGSPTVAAALAAAEMVGSGGERLLRGIAIGYEVGSRVATAIQPAHYKYWHTTGTVGTIGAAAAAAEVLGLDENQFVHAVATATTMAAGLQQAFRSDTMSKPLHAGHAAEQGLLAALVAERGFTGATDILEGATGFGAAMSDRPDWTGALDTLGQPWCVTRATVKNHSCCGHTFAAVDAALALRARGLRPTDVQEIQVATYRTAIEVAGNPDPKTDFEAKFSTAYCVAAALSLGSVRLGAFTEDRLTDVEIRSLVARTIMTVDPDYDAAFPRRRAARVVITDKGGVEHAHERMTRKGDPDDPLTDVELREKFTDLVAPVLGAERCRSLSESVWQLAELSDVRLLSAASMGFGA